MRISDWSSDVGSSDLESLERLAGVGRKTANVVLNIAFGEPTIAVDTHIFRVGNRTGLAPGKTPLEVERKLEKVVPAERKLHAHHWLILHGRYVCKRSEEHTSELQSLMRISYAVFCLKQKKKETN